MYIHEVASLFNVHHETVRRWVRNGELRSRKVGKMFDISESDLHKFVKNNPKYSYALPPKEIDSKTTNKIIISKKDFEIIRDILCLSGVPCVMTEYECEAYNDTLKQSIDKLSKNGKRLLHDRDVVAAAECMNYIRGHKNLLSSVVTYSYDAEEIKYHAQLIAVKADELKILMQKIDIVEASQT